MNNNPLLDLNEYLFETLDRLTNDDLSDEQLEKEIKRSEAIQKVAKNIIENGSLALAAKKHADEYGCNFNLLGIQAKGVKNDEKKI